MMKKSGVKYVLAAAAAMLAIIAVQMILARVFTFHVGEVFSRTAVSALFFYTVMRMTQKTRKAAEHRQNT